MFFEQFENSDGYRVWLSQDEIDQLLEEASDSMHRLAFELGVRCGLRTEEIIHVCPPDINETEAGQMLRVDNAKTGGKRQVPIPPNVATRIDAIRSIRPEKSTEPVIDSSKRTIRRWMSKTGDRLAGSTDEEMWAELSMHDLRRTWATSLKGEDVDAMIVCDWGGWSDLDTFLDAYKGRFSQKAQRKQREKVAWLS